MNNIKSIDLNSIKWKMTKPKRVDDKYYAYFTETDENGKKQKILFQFPKMKYKGPIMTTEGIPQRFTNFIVKEKEIKENIKEIDEWMLDYVKQNKESIFVSREITNEMINMGQTPSIKEIKSDIVIQFNVEKDVEVYDTKKNKFDISDIEDKDEISNIVQFLGLWFSASRWGVAWKVKQMRVHKDKKMKGYMFEDNEEDSDEEEMALPPGV